MNSDQLTQLTGVELAKLIADKKLSPVEVTQAYLERIDRYDGRLHAYITVCREEALQAARKAERAVVRGEKLGPLYGLPLAVKDQFETRGVVTTAGSKSLRGHIPKEDATIINRAKEAGAILLGKLNMTQFADGIGDHYQYGDPPRNPWNQERSAGSSSTGSGIAIAASLCAISLGEDTLGSIRGPASSNGIVGLRPTWGRLSRHGLLPLRWCLDTAGPMTRTVDDVALVMNAIAGHDTKDPQTSKLPVPNYMESLNNELSGVRIGLIEQYMNTEFVNVEVIQAASVATAQLEKLGAKLENASLPLLDQLSVVGTVLAECDGAFVHRQGLRKRPRDYGNNLRRALLTATLIPNQVLQKAMRIRALVRREWLKLFEQFDVLLSPTSLIPPVTIKSEYVGNIKTREEAECRFTSRRGATLPAALAGTPAMSVPCGLYSDNMPIGLQIMGSHFREDVVLKVGHAFQQSTLWHAKRPPL
jgi:aspartyl-tRNA(Asn)/glutamyl-tRNA(Gln) amidotransferase subunit A